MKRYNNLKCSIVMFYCINSISKEGNITLESEKVSGFTLKPVMIPCSSKIQIPHILRILEQGVDGIEIIACPKKKCKLLTGSQKAEKKILYIRNLLEEIRIGKERVGISTGTGLTIKEAINFATERVRLVKSLGPNPMKKG